MTLNRAERRAERKRKKRTAGHHCAAECPVCGVHSGEWPVRVIAFKDDDGEERALAAHDEKKVIEIEVISECEVDRVQWVHIALVGAIEDE